MRRAGELLPGRAARSAWADGVHACARRIFAALLIATGPASADVMRDNLRFTLYHEMGHAVIDQLDVPLLGPEETAADGFALVLADRLHDEAEMADLIVSVTEVARGQAVGAIDPWSPYMHDAQRIAWTICVWYGQNPAARGALARALGLPRGNEPACAEEARRLRAGWAPILARARPAEGRASLLAAQGRGKALSLLEGDIARLRDEIALPRRTPIVQEWCGEDNAFYYHGDVRIVICTEMVDALRAAARR